MPPITAGDREALERFASGVVPLLRSLATEHIHLFPPELQEDIGAAWKEFEEDFDEPGFIAAARDIRTPRAKWAGLYGAQLRLKLAVVGYWRRKWNASVSTRILKKLLDAIDTVLDSLIAATGLGEALKELKDILGNSVDDED